MNIAAYKSQLMSSACKWRVNHFCYFFTLICTRIFVNYNTAILPKRNSFFSVNFIINPS